jgi:hypothetical protein
MNYVGFFVGAMLPSKLSISVFACNDRTPFQGAGTAVLICRGLDIPDIIGYLGITTLGTRRPCAQQSDPEMGSVGCLVTFATRTY